MIGLYHEHTDNIPTVARYLSRDCGDVGCMTNQLAVPEPDSKSSSSPIHSTASSADGRVSTSDQHILRKRQCLSETGR